MLYDTIGSGYVARRVPDPRIAHALFAALDGAGSIANVGAGTGSYEVRQRTVVAVEPSMEMVRQRPEGSAPAVQATAEQLPLKDGCVAAATAILTIHHWSDVATGLGELGRVARDRIAILTWDPDAPAFWLTSEYFPAIVERDRRRFPAMPAIARAFGRVKVVPVPVPHDCSDGFLGAYWRRPWAYLDPAVRGGMSGFVGVPELDPALARLRRDLESGEWNRRFGELLTCDTLDVGYRLVVADL